MKRYGCYHCRFEVQARRQPESCPICGKVSHESEYRASNRARIGSRLPQDSPTLGSGYLGMVKMLWEQLKRFLGVDKP